MLATTSPTLRRLWPSSSAILPMEPARPRNLLKILRYAVSHFESLSFLIKTNQQASSSTSVEAMDVDPGKFTLIFHNFPSEMAKLEIFNLGTPTV